MTWYDRVIPPGGTGKVTVKIDSTSIRGEFRKKALVWSNDPERLSVALYLQGEVRPHISLDPGNYIPLSGVKGKTDPGYVEIINNHSDPVEILGIDNDLPHRVRWRLEEIKPGFVYRLEVRDISTQTGDYTAHLTIRTSNPQKPQLPLIVKGDIRERLGR
ncbi:MAG: hypothetical protein JRJ09_08280 [Deltaproteobacteria bacterium]|nr:hypothetical protein [Deltaproteobacteria bacterium]MBW2048509.1 hypothetical protein [Deltaproteobacteria bacterium]MBW2111915.1 hypothetical protein [Deltaproteobacteria bacterium]MBW2353658.1 hypothetical protein [Deltaproteobacteria bacterium]